MSDPEEKPESDSFIKRQVKRHGLSVMVLSFAVFRVEAAQNATQKSVNEMATDLGILAAESERQGRTLADHTSDLKKMERRLTRVEAQVDIPRSRSSSSAE